MNLNCYKGNIKGLIIYICYKIAHFTTKNKIIHLMSFPIWILYRLIVNWILCVDISEYCNIGKNLVVWHGMGLVVHPNTLIGDNVILHHNTTLGCASNNLEAPIIEDNVNIGTGVVILGKVRIGHNSVIGAGAVITKDVPPKSVVVGNPQKIIKYA